MHTQSARGERLKKFENATPNNGSYKVRYQWILSKNEELLIHVLVHVPGGRFEDQPYGTVPPRLRKSRSVANRSFGEVFVIAVLVFARASPPLR